VVFWRVKTFGLRAALKDDARVFGLSFWEIAIILVVALIILGPKKLPELARSLGKGIREFRKATDDFKSTIDYEAQQPDPPKRQISAEVDEAEIMPAPVNLPNTSAEDAAKAALAEEEAKKAVEAAQAEAVEAAPEPSTDEPEPAAVAVESSSSKKTVSES